VKLGMVGLGRMGGNMTKRLENDGHAVQTYARSGGGTASSLEELVSQLEPRRAVWLMIPAGEPTEQAVQELLGLLDEGDVIVDGGNSNFRDSQRRAGVAAEKGIGYVDAGVSGGIWGLANGYCLMVGGEDDAVSFLEPAFTTLAPHDGYAHVGPSGGGHFVKMVHNGIEYGLMQAYAEGFDIMNSSEFDLDLHEIAGIWRYGSVVRSWLLDLLHTAL
jgi:6-phosphogluconate dehydrogenase